MGSERYYRVGPRFWADSEGWSDDAKLLALYILTSPHRRLEGIFRLPIPYVLADLGWTLERFMEPFQELLNEGFIDYDEGSSIVLIEKALKWQAPENPNQVKSAIRAIEELPQTPLLSKFLTVAERFSKRLTEGLREHFPEGFGEPLTPTPALTPTPEEDADASSVEPDRLDAEAREDFAYWQELTGHDDAKFTRERQKAYRGRRREGYTREQCRRGLEGAATSGAKAKDGTLYDDFRTVLRNGTNLEMYIGFANEHGSSAETTAALVAGVKAA